MNLPRRPGRTRQSMPMELIRLLTPPQKACAVWHKRSLISTTDLIPKARKVRRVPTERSASHARNRAVTLLKTGWPRCSHIVILGVHRVAARLVRLVQSCGSNASLQLQWNARLSRALSPASLACLRGVPNCIHCPIKLTWNKFLKDVTKLDKMNPPSFRSLRDRRRRSGQKNA